MPCEAWIKTADQTNKKTIFLAVLSPFYGLQYGMDGCDDVRSLDENRGSNKQKDDFSRSSHTYPPYGLQYGMDRWDAVRGLDENS
jgi:hypothetical protein